MFERFKNLWALSAGVKVIQNETTGATTIEPVNQPERKAPKGMATIVEINNTISQDFPEEKEI